MTGGRSEDEHSVAASSSSFTLSRLLGESHFYTSILRSACLHGREHLTKASIIL